MARHVEVRPVPPIPMSKAPGVKWLLPLPAVYPPKHTPQSVCLYVVAV